MKRVREMRLVSGQSQESYDEMEKMRRNMGIDIGS